MTETETTEPRKKRVLIVDDDERNRKLLQVIIQKEGYEAIEAADGAAALVEMARKPPDLILLDVMMPGLDGYEVARRIKADSMSAHIPLVFLTALNDRDSRIKGLEAGAEEFINKPVDHLELKVRMRNLLRLKEYSDLMADHKERLENEVRARTEELWETRLEVVRSLGRAAEFRDNETGMHIVRMSRFSQLLAEALGLGRDRAELILHASPMHDIGKVGIPDSILLKPGKLTPDEWKIMKTHATIGHRILSVEKASDLMDAAKMIALGHHEKWDGSGYPLGLAGESIPIEARIVAISDVFDALTSERPYKHAWSVADAMTEIDRLRGTHFEPRIVDVFKDILPDILAIREQHLDVPGESLALSALT